MERANTTSSAWIEQSLEVGLERLINTETPPVLARAMRAAVFPGGARIRPRLLFAVAEACGHNRLDAVSLVAAALEFLHCASLVQDDMNCFDAADTRRSSPALHKTYGAGLALLATDALIVGSFDLLASAPIDDAELSVALVRCLARHTGACGGITAGQAWESEPAVDIATYHDAKTGALFVAAVELGALCAGEKPDVWRDTGKRIGAAYQIADDLIDVMGSAERGGKPVGVDASLGRPNIVNDLGVDAAVALLQQQIDAVLDGLPSCASPLMLRERIHAETQRLLLTGAGRSAA